MSENTTNKGDSNNEIDLLDLFNRIGRAIGRGFKALWKAFLISIAFIVRRWLPLVSAVILGFIVSYIALKSTPSLYTSEMVLRNNAINNELLISYINRLNSLDDTVLSETLNIPLKSSKNIVDLSAFWIVDRKKDKIPDYVDYDNVFDVYDTTNTRMIDRVNIRLNIRSQQSMNNIRDGIISYILSDSIFQQMNRLRIRQNKEMLKRMETDIHDIDSLQKVKYFEEPRAKYSKETGQIVFMQEQATQMYYKDMYDIYKRKQILEGETDLYRDVVTILSDFTIPTKRINGLGFYLKKNVPAFFLTMLLILIILHKKDMLKQWYKKY